MAYQPQPPFFTMSDEDDDVLVAFSLAAAEGELEPPEAKSGYYKVFDSLGHKARLTFSDCDVRIVDWSPEADWSDLKRRLDTYLSSHNLFVDSEQSGAAYAEQAAALIYGENRKQIRPRLPSWLHRRSRKR